MGLIRVLLALSVVLSYTWPGFGSGPLPGGPIAVQCFFMISGFYMSLILTGDRYKGQPVKFWLNRALRIYPVYWLLAAASFANTFLVATEIITAFWAQGLKPVLLMGFVNVFLFGQDLIFWLGTKGGELFWTSSAWSLPQPRLQNYVLIGPAWSLSIELMFYLIAPWIVKLSSRTLLLLVAASLVARHVAYAAGLTFMPWTYMFFPFELAFFLLGVLAHRRLESARSSMTAFMVVCAAILIYQHVPLVEVKVQTVAEWTLLAVLFWALPGMFKWTARSEIGAAIGEMSYPIYLSHMVVVAVLSSHGFGGNFILTIASVLIVSAVLAFGVDRPISRWRHRDDAVARAPVPVPAWTKA